MFTYRSLASASAPAYAVLWLLEQYDAFDRVVPASFHEEIDDEFQRMKQVYDAYGE